jgi:hypothetical protein
MYASAVLLCALLQVSAGFHPSLGFNLCIGEDGHAGIELSHADVECWSEVRRHHASGPLLGSHELAHHPCTDILISAGRASRAPEASWFGPPPATRAAELQRPVARPAAIARFAGLRSIEVQALRARRTVVLIV